jgi:hypothetical protein
MRRLVRKLALAIVFLAVLPVLGTQMSVPHRSAPVMAAGGGASMHYKNSSWPALTTHRVAVGVASTVRVSI